MGLDVYLYRYDVSLEEAKREERKAERTDKVLYAEAVSELRLPLTEGGSLDLPPDSPSRDVFLELLRQKWERAGLSVHGEAKIAREQIEMPSKMYPGHLFKIGYLRSSYNGSGFNSRMHTLGLPDLYDIFGVGRDDYYVSPQWPDVLDRAKRALEAHDLKVKSLGGLDVLEARTHLFPRSPEVSSTGDAMKVWEKERDGHKEHPSSEAYSNRNGEFFMKAGFVTKAVIPGEDCLGQPTVYLVGFWEESEEDEKGDFYREALEIVIEMCEWVLQQPDPMKYKLHWIG